jgi:hypothetical protein
MSQSHEHHPWLKLFTLLGMVFGALLILPAVVLLARMDSLAAGGVGLLLASVLLIAGGVRTLSRSMYFYTWRKVRGWDRVIALVMMVFGVILFIPFFFAAPLMRLFSDPIGEPFNPNKQV